jgi:hypothetical protein
MCPCALLNPTLRPAVASRRAVRPARPPRIADPFPAPSPDPTARFIAEGPARWGSAARADGTGAE